MIEYYRCKLGKYRWRITSGERFIAASSRGFASDEECCRNLKEIQQALKEHYAAQKEKTRS